MFKPQHCGLYFTDDHIQRLRQQKKHSPLKEAWDFLLNARPAGGLAGIQWNGLLYRLNADLAAGEHATNALLNAKSIFAADEGSDSQQRTADTLLMAQCFELLRDHPALTENQQVRWLDAFRGQVNTLNSGFDEHPFVSKLWLAVLNAASGIVLEDEAIFETALEFYYKTIDEEIHPEGYFPQAVEHYVEEESFLNQMQAVQALVLLAEMAHHAGFNLWKHEKRGVSVFTAAAYPLYYYFYPEKWPWNGDRWKPSDGLDQETTSSIFKANAGFLEIVNQRNDRPLKALQLILSDLRPVYDVYGGGLTTLTHGAPARRGIFR